MKKFSDPVSSKQKTLLKVLTCLYENYILNQTPATDVYFLNPTSDNYEKMKSELDAIRTILNLYLGSNEVFKDASGNVVQANVELWSAVAQGMVHYNSATNTENNTFENAVANNVTVNDVISNVGVLKTVQKLNIDDCISKAYQITPIIGKEGNYTQASLVERVGCAGVSNLGFLGMTLQVPIDEAPFNNCYVANCDTKC